MDEYTATVKFPNGIMLMANGTITQMANWADNVIRLNEGMAMTIEIKQRGANNNGKQRRNES